ncbi:MAG TPA: hypothetical protein VFF36_09700, partial [Planctomycetota bacterium]|nr:hypothetical protein [Planctomycetota bacterium]
VYEETPVEGSAWVLDLATPSPWLELVYTHPLAGWGRLASGWPVTVRLYNAAEPPPFVLVIGLSAIYAPFKGDTMVPLPQLLIPLFTGANDDVALGGAWPPGIPPGTEFWFQVWHPTTPPALWTTTSVLVATQP